MRLDTSRADKANCHVAEWLKVPLALWHFLQATKYQAINIQNAKMPKYHWHFDESAIALCIFRSNQFIFRTLDKKVQNAIALSLHSTTPPCGGVLMISRADL